MDIKPFLIVTIIFFLLAVPAACGFQVVATTSVLQDPVRYIGDGHVESICIADPAICPHMQGDVINSRIDLAKDFILDADLFVAHNSSMDKGIVMPKVDEFMEANGRGKVTWVEPTNPNMAWNTPDDAKNLANEVKGWLIDADPGNTTDYEDRYLSYCDLIDDATLSDAETAKISGQDAVVMVWQKESAENWLGLNIVNFYAPEFYMGGQYTAVKLVDDINANPEKYRNVRYVIENMQSGEVGKGVEEALHDRGIRAKRVIFTNFPKSLDGVDSIPDVLTHNRELVTPPDVLKVVATTSVLEDPVKYIGGNYVETVCVADPTICPHMQGDIINTRIQLTRDTIINADLFVAHNSSMDKDVIMPAVEKVVKTNGYGCLNWVELPNPYMAWNTPTNAKNLAAVAKSWLVEAQPWNEDYFNERYDSYCDLIDAADLNGDDKKRIAGQDVIVIVWQRDAAENWLDLNVVNIYAPDFYMKGKYTAVKLVDDINANPEKYRNVHYIIENLQSGELAKGVEEALHDHKIPAQRVIFTNFPKSVQDVDTIPEVLLHNKGLVTPAWVPAKCDDCGDDSDSDIEQSDSLKAGEKTSLSFKNTPVRLITVTAGEDIDTMAILVDDIRSPDDGMPEPEQTVYHYMRITPRFVTDDQIGGAAIDFDVPVSWLKCYEMGINDVVLMRYHGGSWQKLPTKLMEVINEAGHYRATTPGFSCFAIAIEKGAAITAEKNNETTHDAPAQKPTAEINATVTTVKTPVTTAAPTANITEKQEPGDNSAETTPTQKSPVSFITALSALCLGMIIAVKKY